jgi:uncharacterized protein YbjQ (UPF0145 family)
MSVSEPRAPHPYLFEESSDVAARGGRLGDVRENLGIVFGLVVRSVGLKGGVTASIRSLKKGEVTEYTELLEDARRHAIDRMVANAKLLEANGVVAMRFDSSEMGSGMTEVVAYGTAVVVERAG